MLLSDSNRPSYFMNSFPPQKIMSMFLCVLSFMACLNANKMAGSIQAPWNECTILSTTPGGRHHPGFKPACTTNTNVMNCIILIRQPQWPHTKRHDKTQNRETHTRKHNVQKHPEVRMEKVGHQVNTMTTEVTKESVATRPQVPYIDACQPSE